MAELVIVETSEALTRVALSGRLDTQGVEAVEIKLTAQTASRRKPSMVDISGLEFISSLGMGLLVRLSRTLRSHGARMVLVGARDVVKRALLASSIDKVVPMAPDEVRARELLESD